MEQYKAILLVSIGIGVLFLLVSIKADSCVISLGDVLQYAGAILGGVIAMLGVRYTIENESRKDERNRNFSVLPYLSCLSAHPLDMPNNVEEEYKKSKKPPIQTSYYLASIFGREAIKESNQEIYFYVGKSGEISSHTNSTQFGSFCTKAREVYGTGPFFPYLFLYHVNVKNIGLGVARELSIVSIKKDGVCIYEELQSFDLPLGNSLGLYLVFCSDFLQYNTCYEITLEYENMFGSEKYGQKIGFEFGEKTLSDSRLLEFTLLAPPQEQIHEKI